MNNIITTTKEHVFYFPALPAPLSSLPRKLELDQIRIYPRTLFKDLKLRRNHTYLTVGCICICKFCCSTFFFLFIFLLLKDRDGMTDLDQCYSEYGLQAASALSGESLEIQSFGSHLWLMKSEFPKLRTRNLCLSSFQMILVHIKA